MHVTRRRMFAMMFSQHSKRGTTEPSLNQKKRHSPISWPPLISYSINKPYRNMASILTSSHPYILTRFKGDKIGSDKARLVVDGT